MINSVLSQGCTELTMPLDDVNKQRTRAPSKSHRTPTASTSRFQKSQPRDLRVWNLGRYITRLLDLRTFSIVESSILEVAAETRVEISKVQERCCSQRRNLDTSSFQATELSQVGLLQSFSSYRS